jgi:NAD(P)-dependent dehydrogenase (short-subunit alcohol dehydrogenase family)
MEISGTRVLVVGGTSGIGLAAAEVLAKQGALVTVTGRSERRLAAAVDAVPSVRAERADAADRAELDSLFARVGTVDHLVVCASGGSGGGPFASLDLADLRQAFAAKTFVHLEVVQAALPWIAERGSITLVTAGSAQAALPGTVGLAAVNGALEAAVRPLAAELAPIRVNAVSPGVVETPWWDSWSEDRRAAYFADMSRRVPVGRIGQPDEIAAALAMLIGNGFITGHVLVVDGGLHLAR